MTDIFLTLFFGWYASNLLVFLIMWAIRLDVKITIIFAWYDMWIGLFLSQKDDNIYYFPIPMVGFKMVSKC